MWSEDLLDAESYLLPLVLADRPDRGTVIADTDDLTANQLKAGTWTSMSSTAMKITYDRESDALSIRLLESKHECRVVRLTADVTIDFSEGEELVGIEILGASRLSDTPESRRSSCWTSSPEAPRCDSV
jgi:uncharacterized protein YuzE